MFIKKQKKYQHYFWLILFIPLFAFGQTEPPKIHFDQLTIQDGLSHNSVFCILQDADGYMWIGTQNGLNKYDGYTFETYRSLGEEAGRDGFIGKTITALFEDSNENLWVGTRKMGVNVKRKDTDQFVNLYERKSFSSHGEFQASSFFEDKAGNIWITTTGKGVLKYNIKTEQVQNYTVESSGLQSNEAFDIIEDNDGIIWVATSGSGLNFLKEDKFQTQHVDVEGDQNMSGYRKKMLLDDGNVWICTEGSGLYKMNLQTRAFIHYNDLGEQKGLSGNVARDIIKLKNGMYFVATDGLGLDVFDRTTNKFYNYSFEPRGSNTINSNALFCFEKDRSGNIWVGTYNGGINIYKPNKTWFEFTRPISGESGELAQRSVLSLTQSREGTIWVGTDGGGLNQLNQDDEKFSFSVFQNDPKNQWSLSGNVVKSIFEDSQGVLWVGTFGEGLNKFDQKNKRFTRLQHESGNNKSLSGNNVWTIAEQPKGRLLLGTIGNGFNVLDISTNRFHSYLFDPNDEESIVQDDVMVVFVDREEQVWIGSMDEGLDLWDQDKDVFIHHRHNPNDSTSLSNNEIRSIFQDAQGQLWIGTEGGGLNKYLGANQFFRITENDGLSANSVMGITEDHEGLIWVSTFAGISRINPETMEIRNFDFHTGKQSNQFNQAALYTAEGGKIYFGGINGLHSIQPEKIVEIEQNHEILFTDLKVFNKSVSLASLSGKRKILKKPIERVEEVRLRYFDNSITIDFATLDFTNPQQNKFQFLLEGMNEEWQKTGNNQHSANYTNLDPGEYIFRVRNGEDSASIRITIQPPFWKTTWFIIALTILILGLAYFSIRFLIKRREADLKRKMLEAESEILQLRNENLQTQVSAKNSKLLFSAVQMAHKNEILTEIKGELQNKEKESEHEIRQLIRTLDRELNSEDYWKEFNTYFDQVDHKFVQQFSNHHPMLTKHDIRLCTLLRINLSTKEIASLLNISVRGVEKGRYRLKKRLELAPNEDLARYINKFRTTKIET